MTARRDWVGQRFGRRVVTAVRFDGNTIASCRCDCGRVDDVRANQLYRTTQCASCRAVEHGEARSLGNSTEYEIWMGMNSRCHRPSHKRYHRYGGRGITVCARWRQSFLSFLEDVGRRPSNEHSLDRIDNDGGYEPGNVRWATRKEQARNRRSNRFVDLGGEKVTIAEAAERIGVSPESMRKRLTRTNWDANIVASRIIDLRCREFRRRSYNWFTCAA